MTAAHLVDPMVTGWQHPEYAKTAESFRCPSDLMQKQGALSYAYNLWNALGTSSIPASSVEAPAGLVMFGEWHRQNLNYFNISRHSPSAIQIIQKNIISENWHIDGSRVYMGNNYGIFTQPATLIHGSLLNIKSQALMHDGHTELLEVEGARANAYQIWKR